MTSERPRRTRLLILAGIVLVACLVGWLVWRPTAPKPSTGSSTGQAGAPASQSAATTGAADFSYSTPAGWAKLPQKYLDAQTAASGIGNTASETSATFSVKINDSTPGNQSQLVSGTLDELKKLSDFTLVASASATVGGQPAHVFDYQTGSNPKIRQQMYVLIYKGQTFFLLFSANDASFASQGSAFSGILASFKLR
jgi:hypothetical protein